MANNPFFKGPFHSRGANAAGNLASFALGGPTGLGLFQGGGALYNRLFNHGGGAQPPMHPGAILPPSMMQLGMGPATNPFLTPMAPNAAPGNLALNRPGSASNKLSQWGLGTMPGMKTSFGGPTAQNFVNSINWGSIGAPQMSFGGPGSNFYGGGGGLDNYLAAFSPGNAHLAPPTRIFGPAGAVK